MADDGCVHNTPDYKSNWHHVTALLNRLDSTSKAYALSYIVKGSCKARADTVVEQLNSEFDSVIGHLDSSDTLEKLFPPDKHTNASSVKQSDDIVMQDVVGEDHSSCKHSTDSFLNGFRGMFACDPDPRQVWGILAKACSLYENNQPEIQRLWTDHQISLRQILAPLFNGVSADEISQVLNHTLHLKRRAKRPSQTPVPPGVFNAFNATYKGGLPSIFLNTLDRLAEDDKYHARSISFVQSSCTGKTRLLHEVAKKRITLMMNVREILPHGQSTFPPADDIVRDHLKPVPPLTFEGLVIHYTKFLWSLFTVTRETLSRLGHDSTRWYEDMYSWNHERDWCWSHTKFWMDVIEKTEKAPSGIDDTDMNDAANALLDIIPTIPKETKDKPEKLKLLIVIDEAHVLTELVEKDTFSQRTYLNTFEHVLKAIKSLRIFTIFLSTNSQVEKLAPPETLHPSWRGTTLNLLPPLTEFVAFDVFAPDLKGVKEFTLDTPCLPELVTSFGRPQWHVMLDAGTRLSGIIEFAMIKLLNTTAVPAGQLGGLLKLERHLAWMSIRIMLDFDVCARAKWIQSRLVESYMRIVYCIPEHRENMLTGAPSEPILAEAAARLINRPENDFSWLSTLNNALSGGLLTKGDRGEIVFRALFMSACDKALNEIPPRQGLQYHQPIRLLNLLKHLFVPAAYDQIMKATPVIDTRDGALPSLETAFKDAYVNVSHFIPAGDYDVVKLPQVAQFFWRGCAIHCRECQREIDGLVPLAFSSNGLKICAFSVFQWQIKNWLDTEDVIVAPEAAGPPDSKGKFDHNRPILSMVFELENFKKNEIRVLHRVTQPRRVDDWQDHYQITVRGLLPFNFDTSERALLKQILDTCSILKELPRQNKENLDLLARCQPTMTMDSMEFWHIPPVQITSDDIDDTETTL